MDVYIPYEYGVSSIYLENCYYLHFGDHTTSGKHDQSTNHIELI